ncbi:hypothetical protein H7170_02060 [Candidatus Gracilibacteria bacterium]|nr:hypothetical protein [Candidatus Gracilibacteria bacterium]
MNTPLTNEQKLDEIYSILQSQRSSQSRAFWYRILKWCIILGLGYFTLSHPGYVTSKIMEYVGPIIVEQMKSVMSTQKEGLLKQMKDLMPTQAATTPEKY